MTKKSVERSKDLEGEYKGPAEDADPAEDFVMEEAELQPEETLEQLRARISKMEATIAEQNAELEAIHSQADPERGGWLITTPNQNYSGKTAGVPFVNGKAFVSMQRGEDALAQQRWLMTYLENEFNYEVQELGSDEVARMKMKADAEFTEQMDRDQTKVLTVPGTL